MTIDKTSQPSEVEGRITGLGNRRAPSARPCAGAKAYSIVIPPPNVDRLVAYGPCAEQYAADILCRFERMRGKDVLWQPGTDHAGIATQMVVERH